MSVETQHLQYRNVLANLAQDGFSDPILCTDFKTIKAVFNLISSPDFDVVVIGSYNPSYGPVPDITQPLSPTNEYHLLGYVDESDGSNYAATTPFNPGGTATDLAINVETTGINWIIVGISNYAAGTVEFCHVDLYSNFN